MIDILVKTSKYSLSLHPIPKFVIQFSVLIFLLVVRTRGKIANPGIWVEDSYYLQQFNEEGLSSLFNSSNDFLNLGTRLLSAFTQSLTIVHYPITSILLTLLLSAALCVLIAHIIGGPKGFLCATLVIVFPADPEVLGLPSYFFWILGVYLLAIAICNYQQWSTRQLVGHCCLIVFAGLSGPLVILTLPIMFLRLVRDRFLRTNSSRTLLITGFLLVPSLIQIAYRLSVATVASEGRNGVDRLLRWPIEVVGSYFVGVRWADKNTVIGLLVLLLIASYVWLTKTYNFTTVAITVLFLMSCLQSALRVDVQLLHPIIAGPRYYFVPFVLFSWLIVHLLSDAPKSVWLPITTVIAVVVSFDAYSALDRPTDSLNWPSYIATCDEIPGIIAPIYFDGTRHNTYFDGTRHNTWPLPLTPALCRKRPIDKLVSRTSSELAFNYQPLSNWNRKSLVCADAVIKQRDFDGSDYWNSGFYNVQIFGTSGSADTIDKHSLALKIKRGESVLFRWGTGNDQTIRVATGDETMGFATTLPPTQEWVALSFVHPALPDEFNVFFHDDSNDWGSWSSIGLRKNCD